VRSNKLLTKKKKSSSEGGGLGAKTTERLKQKKIKKMYKIGQK